MRIVSRTARSLLEQKREKSMRKRQAAGTLATAFPRVEQIRIQLRFISKLGAVPAAQTHALYPSAQAYFEFACPHGDGTLHCPGTRTGGGTTRPPCNQRVDYWIAAQYQAIARATG